MSKSKKKRNKPYQGVDATPDKPTVRRYTAVPRSPWQEWWLAHKRIITLSAKIGGIALIVIWLIIEAVRLIF